MNGENDIDITYDESFDAYVARQYKKMTQGKSLSATESGSTVLMAANMHQYPMDPPDVQAQRMQMMKALPDPQGMWLLYYQGAYAKKHGLKKQTSAEAPGDVEIVKKKDSDEKFDITGE